MTIPAEPRVLVTAADTLEGAAGGKARNLARLAHLHRVPEFFALTPAALHASLNAERRALLAEDAEAALHGLTLPPGLLAELHAALAALGEGPFAVRSSALDEDGVAYSFAGQLASFLNVTPDDVPARVVDVWRSGLTGHALAYRAQHGLGPADAPGVIVQRMVPAAFAGVAFSADPVTGDRATVVISAVAGLADALVSGDESGETYRVRAGTPGPDGLLSAERQREVAALARACEAHLGSPQDVEWAVDAQGTLFLLQSRPITTLEGAVSTDVTPDDPSGPRTWWDNSNIVESYSGVTTPLTFSFARRAYGAVYRRFCRLLGVPGGVIDDHGAVFDGMIGLHRGRVYYNLSHWYRVLALLPGFSVNRPFMEQMMGVAQGMPEDLVVRSSRGRAADLALLARTVLGLVAAHRALPAMKARFFTRLETVLAEPNPPLRERSLGELAAYYRSLETQLLGRWDAPLVNDFFAMIFYGALRRLGQNWLGDEHGSLQNDLVTASGGIVSAEPAERLARLATLARSAGVVDVLAVGTPAEIDEALLAHPDLRREADAYLARFSDRCVGELKLESPTLGDDPTPMWRAVASLARHAPTLHHGAQLRQDAESLVRSRLRGVRRLLFGYVLRGARARVRDRENLRFERTRVFGRARVLLREMGERLVTQGRLARADDVFYLEVEELLGFAEGTGTTSDLAGLAAVRRAEFTAHHAAPDLPRRFATRGAAHGSAILPAAPDPDPVSPDADLRSGLGCSPGRLRGTVRVVIDPHTTALSGPTIIVAERTDPGWILVLPLARGLIVERGSLLSHSAIVSRELGIPAVVGVPGVTTWLRDGDEVELDGALGTVRLLRRAEDAVRPTDADGQAHEVSA